MDRKFLSIYNKEHTLPLPQQCNDTVMIAPNIDTTLCSDCEFDEIKVVGVYPDDDLQTELFRVLKPSCKLSVVGGMNDREAGQELSSDLKMQGFVDVMAAKDPATEERFVIAQKPSWSVSETAVVPAAAKTIVPINNSNSTNTWKMSTGDLADEELVDENQLLDDSDVLPKPSSDEGCKPDPVTGKKKACKNCSCGLAEIEAAEAAGRPTDVVVKASSCGNCSKGDAFRCASCPFLGKPAFEPGQEKLILALGSDDI